MKKYIAYFLTFMPFMFFLFGYIFSYFLMRSTVFLAPNLVGLKLSQALTIAAKNHATIKLLHQQECPGVEPETIISQKPSSGRLIKPNQVILITIAKEACAALAPDLKLQKLSTCQKNCKELGLKIKQYPMTYPLPQETCIGQIPQAKEAVTDKKIIVYTAQEKPNSYLMPNFINKNLNEILQLFSDQEIAHTVFANYQTIEPPYADDLIITGQKPKAGSFVHLGNTLHIQLEVVEAD